MNNTNIIAEAYEATKGEGNASYDALPGDYQSDLAFRAQSVDTSGVMTTAFEYKYKELSGKAKADEPVTPLGTLHAIGETRTSEQVEAAGESEKASEKAKAADDKAAEKIEKEKAAEDAKQAKAAEAKIAADKAAADKAAADAKAKSAKK